MHTRITPFVLIALILGGCTAPGEEIWVVHSGEFVTASWTETIGAMPASRAIEIAREAAEVEGAPTDLRLGTLIHIQPGPPGRELGRHVAWGVRWVAPSSRATVFVDAFSGEIVAREASEGP